MGFEVPKNGGFCPGYTWNLKVGMLGGEGDADCSSMVSGTRCFCSLGDHMICWWLETPMKFWVCFDGETSTGTLEFVGEELNA